MEVEGFDTVSFAGSNTGVRADLQARIGQGGYAQGDEFINIEALEGTPFADELTGNDAANRLSGLAGDDQLSGLEGNDVLLGGDGRDLLRGGEGADTLDGGPDLGHRRLFPFASAGYRFPHHQRR